MQGVGCRVQGGVGFWGWTLAEESTWVQSEAPAHARFSIPDKIERGVQGAGFRVQGSGFWVQGSGFRVQGSGFGVLGAGFRVQGSGFRVQRRCCHRTSLTPTLTTPDSPKSSGNSSSLREGGSEAGSCLRLIDSCITQLKAQEPPRTCNENNEEEEGVSVLSSHIVPSYQ